jgi:TolB-like protein
MKLFEELKRRNVFRVGAAYLLLAWVLIQVTDTVSPALKLPEWTLALVIWMSIIGFPLVLFLAWAFEVTPEGLKREEDVDRSESITADTGRKINFMVIGLLVVAVVLLLGDKFSGTDADDPAEIELVAEQVADEADDGYDSIGVLPFVNMSGDPEQEYFSDGIAEELLNALAKLKDLQVAARTSSFAFKGQNRDITEIGRQLNVDTVLEGSVRKSGSKLRITAQLIDVDDGYHLWSGTYDRELTDIFAVQDEITAAIVEALVLHLDTETEAELAATEVTNMSAYDAYLQGRHELRKGERSAVREALRLFRVATDADPNFAPAWAARAKTVIMMREDHFVEGIPREESHMLARSNIDRALAIDPNLAEAYVAESYLQADNYQYEDALLSVDRALELNPNLAEAWSWRSRLLSRFGRIGEAREGIRKAVELDPHNPVPAILAANLAEDYYDPEFLEFVVRNGAQFPRVRQIEALIRLSLEGPLTAERFQQTLDANPGFPSWEAMVRFQALKEIDADAILQRNRNGRDFLMWIYMGTDQWDIAQAMYDEMPQDTQKSVLNLEELSIMQTAQNRCEEMLATLREAHGDVVRIYGEVPPTTSRANVNLALNRVYCLRDLGRDPEAEEILAAANEYIETLRANTVYGFFVADAKLRVLEGDVDGAVTVLEDAHARNELLWMDRYEPIVRNLRDEPRFNELFAAIDEQIDAVRAELGMPPAEL